jgi:hypothetical protein
MRTRMRRKTEFAHIDTVLINGTEKLGFKGRIPFPNLHSDAQRHRNVDHWAIKKFQKGTQTPIFNGLYV